MVMICHGLLVSVYYIPTYTYLTHLLIHRRVRGVQTFRKGVQGPDTQLLEYKGPYALCDGCFISDRAPVGMRHKNVHFTDYWFHY